MGQVATILVTGAGGHFGSFLVGQLLRRDFEVVGLDTLLYGGEGMLSFFSHPRFRFHRLDLTEEFPGPVEAVDYVVHLAALVGPVCNRDTRRAWETNYGATAKIRDWVKRVGARLIFASTCSNYGALTEVATEDSPLMPLGTYAETKVAAEKLVGELGPSGVALRFGTLAGLSPRPRFDTLLNQLAYEACSTGRIECYRPRARRPFAHIADAADAVTTVLTHWSKISHPCYNVVGFNTTVGELAAAIRDHTRCEVVEVAASADDRDYAVSAERIADELGFRPQVAMETCVREMCSAVRLGVVRPRAEHYNDRHG